LRIIDLIGKESAFFKSLAIRTTTPHALPIMRTRDYAKLGRRNAGVARISAAWGSA
jgi:hypothetical protein